MIHVLALLSQLAKIYLAMAIQALNSLSEYLFSKAGWLILTHLYVHMQTKPEKVNILGHKTTSPYVNMTICEIM